jgi:hypothetical protein
MSPDGVLMAFMCIFLVVLFITAIRPIAKITLLICTVALVVGLIAEPGVVNLWLWHLGGIKLP